MYCVLFICNSIIFLVYYATIDQMLGMAIEYFQIQKGKLQISYNIRLSL